MKIKIKNSAIEADVADNFLKRIIGLSLSKKKNMFFPLPYEARWSLWMFAVRYPIKMVFVDKDKVVIDIKRAEPLTLDPRTWKTYYPREPCKYVLETPFDLKVEVGDELSW
jgi:uncharacterized membrane protein (UPF0127 family)